MSNYSSSTPTYCFKRLNGFDAIGFDLDFTLGRYHTLNLMKLIHKEMVRFLVQGQGYPEALLDTSFDHKIAQKGLCMDKTNGLILKFDQNLRVARASFGRQFLSKSEIESCYPNSLPASPESDERFRTWNGPWTIPMISILADYIEIEGLQREGTNPSVWERLSEDISRACYTMFYTIDYPKPHIDSNFPILKGFNWSSFEPKYFTSVIENMEKYCSKCDRLRFIQELRAAGFKTFIVTDARYEFADVFLRFLFGNEWRLLFDVTLTHAMKPRTFFNPDHQFEMAGTMGSDGFYQREEFSKKVSFEDLRPFHVYGGGNKAKLTEFLAKMCGNVPPEKVKILYVGDSMRSDVISMKRESKYEWKYVWVQSELESITCLDHSLVGKHSEMNTDTSDWGHLLFAETELSYFGAEVEQETDYVISDLLELGGLKNPIRTYEVFKLLETARIENGNSLL